MGSGASRGVSEAFANLELKPDVAPLLTVRVHNRTTVPQTVALAYGGKRPRKGPARPKDSHSHCVDIPAGSSQDVVVPSLVHKKIRVDPSTVSLRATMPGAVWKDQSDTVHAPQPGCELELVVDKACPPLSPKDIALVKTLLQEAVEGLSVELPPSCEENTAGVPAMWRHVTGRLGRNGNDDRVVLNTRDMIPDACGHFNIKSRHWGCVYDSHPRAPTIVAGGLQPGDVLKQTSYRIDIYHRALDRFPHEGHEDIHVIQHIFTPGEPPSLSAVVFYIQDQEAKLYCRPHPRAVTMARQFAERAPAALISAFAGKHGASADIQYTIDDPRPDCESASTEWSSVEVLLTDAKGGLAGRIHRRARLPNDTNIDQSLMPPVTPPPSPAVPAALSAMEAACGMGSVQQWSDSIRSGRHRDLQGAQLHELDYVTGIYGFTPIYFRGTPGLKSK